MPATMHLPISLQHFFAARMAEACISIPTHDGAADGSSKGSITKMQITDVRLRKVNSENRMKAVASVTFDNEFAVHDIKVIESQNGLFIAMPSRKTPNGDFKDIAHPINAETREKVQNAILEAYDAPETEESAE